MVHRPILTLVGLSALIGTQSLIAGTITIPTTIRDFVNPAVPGYAAHPDFETTISTVETGVVSPTLGVDNKPVFVGPGIAYTGAANFNQWYNDTPGVNVSTTFPMVLTEVAPGVYEYSNGSFFPIDDALLGNQGRSHNYHFTLELHSTFTYELGQTFSFTGDDDLWLFINKSLAVDLGGVHGAASASISLDSLGLTPGTDYSFDLFFAERHTSESNFRMQTAGIVLRPSLPDGGSTLALCGLGLGLLALARRRLG